VWPIPRTTEERSKMDVWEKGTQTSSTAVNESRIEKVTQNAEPVGITKGWQEDEVEKKMR